LITLVGADNAIFNQTLADFGLDKDIARLSLLLEENTRHGIGPEDQKGHLITNALARPFSIFPFRLADPWSEKPTQKLFWISASGRRLGDAGFITALLSQHRPGDPCQRVGESGGQNVGVEVLSGAREPDPEAVLRPACRP
jgi:hypothetical protein